MKSKVKRYIWTEENDAFLMANYNKMSISKMAETLGCSSSLIVQKRKKMGLKAKKQNKKDSKLDSCINKDESKKFYCGVANHLEYNGIDSETPKVLYQNNKEDITVVTPDNGVLRIDKRHLKSFANELTDICEVFTQG